MPSTFSRMWFALCSCLVRCVKNNHHFGTTQATDTTKKEAFRKYLESSGVIDALTKGTMLDPP